MDFVLSMAIFGVVSLVEEEGMIVLVAALESTAVDMISLFLLIMGVVEVEVLVVELR